MGGCRCSYRSCSVRTDGKTHMFHFPVYDKVRCHQWILNAQRYEFFNLTVSQVRNRVVCQNHFTDDCFMNYKKEKLTFGAVPTENGPYCDSKNDKVKSEVAEAYSFIENIIENEPFYIDKKANSSLKYVDFLTNIDVPPVNTDLWERENVFIVPPKVIPKDENVSDKQIKTFHSLIKTNKPTEIMAVDVETNDNEKVANNLGFTKKENKLEANHQERSNTNSEPNTTLLINPFCAHFTNLNPTDSATINISENNNHLNSSQAQNATVIKNKDTQKVSKIKIISERTVTEPMPFIGKLESVSPSLILPMPNRKKVKEPIVLSNPEIQTPPKPQLCYIEIMPNASEDPEMQTKSEIVSDKVSQITTDGPENEKCEIKIDTFSVPNPQNLKLPDAKTLDNFKEEVGKVPVLKNKIAPERVAAIERKRNFNKKLRDIVESCLQKPDPKPTSILKVKDTENVSCNEQVQIPKETRSPATKDNKMMIDLEARLEKMENMLAKKIEQNSERISELRNSFKEQKSSHSVYTQTLCNEESYKKYLFNEISQYLTPDSRSIIYEELFINKFVQKESECELKVKRRRRR